MTRKIKRKIRRNRQRLALQLGGVVLVGALTLTFVFGAGASATPQPPTITSGPAGETSDRTATFTWSEAVGSLFTMGPAVTEGELLASPGDWVSVGWHFRYEDDHPASTVTFRDTVFTFAVGCADGSTPTSRTWTITAGDVRYHAPLNNASWIPSEREEAAASYQVAARIPPLCGSRSARIGLGRGASFDSRISSTNRDDEISIQFHYRVPAATANADLNCSTTVANPDPGIVETCGGRWSPTKAAVPGISAHSVAFACSLDGHEYVPCGGGTEASQTYSQLTPGPHTFRVKTSFGMAESETSSRQWTVLGSSR